MQNVFGDLAVKWESTLRSPSPAALAWDLLSERTSARARTKPGGSAYSVLPRLHADAVVLRYRLGIGREEIAELLGLDALEVNGMLRFATRKVSEAWHMRQA
ncbi:hypothetical protein [Streptomyces sp. NPDC088755]|uniref:hypothetical protein n=1 Tax=Streptomyces sp. NPDC088755 TaxID=3365888 RepID=UPI00381EBFA5